MFNVTVFKFSPDRLLRLKSVGFLNCTFFYTRWRLNVSPKRRRQITVLDVATTYNTIMQVKTDFLTEVLLDLIGCYFVS